MEHFGRQPEKAGITGEWVHEHCAGMSSARKYEMMHKHMSPDARPLSRAMIEEMRAVRKQLMPRYMASDMVKVMDGAVECVERLVATSFHVVAASNKTQAEVLAVFERFNFPHFNATNVVGAHMMVMGRPLPSKPDPAMVLHASRGFFPGHCIVIGDSDNDILAARAANMQAWGVIGSHPDKTKARNGLITAGAHRVFDNLQMIPVMAQQFRQGMLVSPAGTRRDHTIRG